VTVPTVVSAKTALAKSVTCLLAALAACRALKIALCGSRSNIIASVSQLNHALEAVA
jgi:hypothetical protein